MKGCSFIFLNVFILSPCRPYIHLALVQSCLPLSSITFQKISARTILPLNARSWIALTDHDNSALTRHNPFNSRPYDTVDLDISFSSWEKSHTSLTQGRCHAFRVFGMPTNEKKAPQKRLKIHFNPDFSGPEHHQLMYGIKINPLLHWCFPIRGDIALPTGRAISLRIGKHQCNNGLISCWLNHFVLPRGQCTRIVPFPNKWTTTWHVCQGTYFLCCH